MTNVFGHGRLRLYMLRLLEEQPRHGYELIRLLEDRFMGLYAPSAGTVYPRLQRLEAEGLVVCEEVDGRKTYRLTDAGREELANAAQELSDLEAEVVASIRSLAADIKQEVHESVRVLRDELKQAAREVRRQERTTRRGAVDELQSLERELDRLRLEVLAVARTAAADAVATARDAVARARDDIKAVFDANKH